MGSKEWSFSGREVLEKDIITIVGEGPLHQLNRLLCFYDTSERALASAILNDSVSELDLSPENERLVEMIDSEQASEYIFSLFKRKVGRIKDRFYSATNIKLSLSYPAGDVNCSDDRAYWVAENLLIPNPAISQSQLEKVAYFDVICGG